MKLDKTHLRLIGACFLVALGALLLTVGWFGVSGEPSVARQTAYLASGGLGGLAAVVVGAGLLISEDLREERKRIGRIESSIEDIRTLLRVERQRADGHERQSEDS